MKVLKNLFFFPLLPCIASKFWKELQLTPYVHQSHNIPGTVK
jgi:hypothetical protein